MRSSTQNSKVIIKNTLLLYFRMLFNMFVGLFTSRVILNSLGVEDFGIYNVVGGVIAMFSVISGSLNASISRFLTYELGTGNKEKLRHIFSSSVTIQILLSIIVLILAETIGLWFLNTHMVIPEERMFAANVVYQLSFITFAINLISVPYNASIISHEKMSAFAYISIIEVIGKLIVAYGVCVSPIDKLIFYAIMMTLIAVMLRCIYGWYCKKKFEECVYNFIWDKNLLKRMFSFAGWNFLGASSDIFRDHGGNIIINVFFGPSVNTARGIAMQANHAIRSFVMNFTTALNPQITKSYACGNYEYMMTLIFLGARMSFYILLILCLPILVNTNYIVILWLGQIPNHTVNFIRLVLIFTMNESLSYTLITAMLATGRIRNYQIVVGSLALLNLPLSYLCLKMGGPVESVFLVAIFVSVICEFARLIMMRAMINLSVLSFLRKVYLNVCLVAIVAASVPFFLQLFMPSNFFTFLLSTIVSIINAMAAIYFVGCDSKERTLVLCKVKSVIRKYSVNYRKKVY